MVLKLVHKLYAVISTSYFIPLLISLHFVNKTIATISQRHLKNKDIRLSSKPLFNPLQNVYASDSIYPNDIKR
jgi:hypothetical protein